MLKFKLNNSLDEKWKIHEGVWVNGVSFIRPFMSSHVEHCFFFSKNKLIFVVREKNFLLDPLQCFQVTSLTLGSQELEVVLIKLRSWNLETIIIEINLFDNTINITKNGSNKIALYYTFYEDFIHCSWEIKELLGYLRYNDIFDKIELLRTLTLVNSYTSRTIYKNIFLLSERSEIKFKGQSSYSLKLPESSPIYHERILRNNKEVYPFFWGLIKDYIRQFQDGASSSLGCELSGWLDSALVSIALAELCSKQINTFSMLLPGIIGKQQQYRRQEIINKFNLIDNIVSAIMVGPLINNGLSLRTGIVSVYDEIYHDALFAMLKPATLYGNTGVLTTLILDKEIVDMKIKIKYCRRFSSF